MTQVDTNDTSRGFLLRGLPNAGRRHSRASVRVCDGGRHRTTLNDNRRLYSTVTVRSDSGSYRPKTAAQGRRRQLLNRIHCLKYRDGQCAFPFSRTPIVLRVVPLSSHINEFVNGNYFLLQGIHVEFKAEKPSFDGN